MAPRPPRRPRSLPFPRPFGWLLLLLLVACDHYAAANPPDRTPELSPAPAGQARPAACAGVVTDQAAAIVETLRASDGSCVPAGEAVLYRCDPSYDPIAELGTSTGVRRFLGGAYAVPVDALPADAREIGVAGLGRVYVEGDEGRALFVQSGTGLQRWLRLPDAAGLAHPPTALLIGDSILDGAATAVTEALPDWSVSIDAEVGRPSSGGVAVAESLTSPLPDVVVVELGVNDHDASAFLANAQRILAALEGTNLVVWVNAHGPDPETAAVDRAILRVMGPDPVGAIADWDRAVPVDELSSDGVHLLAGHEDAFAAFLAPVLRTWLDAVDGRGPTGCQDSVRSAIAG